MRRSLLFVLSIVVVAFAGAAFGFAQINKANFGVPGFYVWKTVSGKFDGAHRIKVNGVSLYYETYGQGPPVLVLHGAGGFLETMHYFISALALTHTVIAVDSRAQGRSTDSLAPLSYSLMAHDMFGLLDALHLGQVDVLGWSDGGIVGLDMAMKQPDRIRRLIVIGANYDVNGIDSKQLTPGLDADIVRQIRPFYESIAPDPAHFAVMLRKVTAMIRTQPHYTTAQLGRIRARTLILAGEHDVILRQHTDTLARSIPYSREFIVPGASHFGPLEQPQTYDDLAVNFLNAP